MAKLSYNELKTYVAGVVTEAKLSNASFVETRDNVVGLLDKIGKIVTLDTNYQVDKLNMFDGEYLSFGKTIEEWQQDLIMPTTYDASGSGALSPADPTYRPPYYSYTLGRNKIKTTIRNNDVERAVHFDAQLVEIVAMQYKRLEDSMAVFRYQLKREMLGKYISMCVQESIYDDIGGASSITEYAISTAYSVNDVVCDDDGTPTKVAIFVKAVANTNTKTWATLVAEGTLIELDLISDIAKPVDTTTGEAFLELVKGDLEVFKDLSEGHSLNGNSLGAVETPILILKQGIQNVLDVQTFAGAFNEGRLTPNVEIVVVKDFGEILDADDNDLSDKFFAVLLDRRGMRLHNTYNATRENLNGDGDFINLFRHTEDVAYVSRNTAIKCYGDFS